MVTKAQLLQIDATIITGVLILLTVASSAQGFLEGVFIKLLVTIIIVPFAGSAVIELWILMGKKYHKNDEEFPAKPHRASLFLAWVGFMYLAFAIIVIGLYQFIFPITVNVSSDPIIFNLNETNSTP